MDDHSTDVTKLLFLTYANFHSSVQICSLLAPISTILMIIIINSRLQLKVDVMLAKSPTCKCMVQLLRPLL